MAMNEVAGMTPEQGTRLRAALAAKRVLEQDSGQQAEVLDIITLATWLETGREPYAEALPGIDPDLLSFRRPGADREVES